MRAPRFLLFVIALTTTGPALAASPRPALTLPLSDYAVIGSFLTAVDHYVVVHRWLAPIEPDLLCLPDDTRQAVNELAQVPLEARPAPREGEIFTPNVAELFRRRLAATMRLHEFNAADLSDDMDEDERIAARAEVAEPPPLGAGNSALMWLVESLPRLPEEMDYRLVGRDLVLVDVRANIVVDVLRTAVVRGG